MIPREGLRYGWEIQLKEQKVDGTQKYIILKHEVSYFLSQHVGNLRLPRDKRKYQMVSDQNTGLYGELCKSIDILFLLLGIMI